MAHNVKDPADIQTETPIHYQLLTSSAFLAFVHPIFKVQKIMQIQSFGFPQDSSMKFSGFLDGYRYLKQRDGVNSLWDGFLFGAFTFGIDFCEDEIMKHVFKMDDYIPKEEDYPTPSRVKKYFLGNFFSKLAIAMVVHPLENIWIRIITDVEPVSKYSGVLDCIQNVFRKEGLSGFYNGFVWAISRVLLKASIKTLSYYLQIKTDSGCPKSPLMYPLTAIEEILDFGVETLRVRSVLGLPLVAPGTVGLGKLVDIYSGFSIEMYTILTEMVILKAYKLVTDWSMNELPNFMVQ